jgi:hypothetical protein
MFIFLNPSIPMAASSPETPAPLPYEQIWGGYDGEVGMLAEAVPWGDTFFFVPTGSRLHTSISTPQLGGDGVAVFDSMLKKMKLADCSSVTSSEAGYLIRQDMLRAHIGVANAQMTIVIPAMRTRDSCPV